MRIFETPQHRIFNFQVLIEIQAGRQVLTRRYRAYLFTFFCKYIGNQFHSSLLNRNPRYCCFNINFRSTCIYYRRSNESSPMRHMHRCRFHQPHIAVNPRSRIPARRFGPVFQPYCQHIFPSGLNMPGKFERER